MRLRHFAVLLLCAATSPAFAAGGQNLVTDAQRVQELTAGLKEAFDKRDAKGFIAKTEALRRLIDLPPDDFISAARAAAAIKQPLLAKYLYDEYFLRVGASDELFALATTERDAILMEADAELQAERDAAAELTATVGKVVGALSRIPIPPIRRSGPSIPPTCAPRAKPAASNCACTWAVTGASTKARSGKARETSGWINSPSARR